METINVVTDVTDRFFLELPRTFTNTKEFFMRFGDKEIGDDTILKLTKSVYHVIIFLSTGVQRCQSNQLYWLLN